MGTMSKIYIHAVTICFVLVVGFLIGMTFLPGAWYDGLVKPGFTPPSWLFAPVWTIIYVLIGWAGARLVCRRDEMPVLLVLWAILLLMNFSWSPVFFGLHFIFLGFLIILFMFIGILAFIALAWQRERFVALLFVPYAVWICYAMVLNGTIVYLN